MTAVATPINVDAVEACAAIAAAGGASTWAESQLRSTLERPGSQVFGTHIDGELVGYAISADMAGVVHLLDIAVVPRAQGCGHGRELLRAVLDAARAGGAEAVTLEVRPSNVRAISVYRAAGFADVGRRSAYYSDPREDALIMTLQLDGNA